MPYSAAQYEIRPLNESLRHVRFPISKAELLETHGHVRLQLVHGKILTLASALEDIIQPSFKSLSDLAMAIGEHRRADEMQDW
jgi:hypothetical protein